MLDCNTVTLDLLRAAHNFQLPGLFNACESKLLSSINEECVRDFYQIAKEVNAKMLVEKCTEWRSTLDDDSSPDRKFQIGKEDDLDTLSLCSIDLGKFNSVSS